MTSDPSDVGHACKPVFGMNVKDVLDGHDGAEQVTSGRVNDALWLSSRAGGLMEENELVRKSRPTSHTSDASNSRRG
jgi:hypothetical protein